MVRPKSLCIFAYANSLRKSDTRLNQIQRPPAQADCEQAERFLFRHCLLSKEDSSLFKRRTHYIGKVVNYNAADGKYGVQIYSTNGDKEGKPLEENPDHISVLPRPGAMVVLGPSETEYELLSYVISAGLVELQLPPKEGSQSKDRTKSKAARLPTKSKKARLRDRGGGAHNPIARATTARTKSKAGAAVS